MSHLSTASGERSRASVVEQTDGQIRGVLLDGDGQPLAARPVHLSRPSSEGPGRLTVLTDATGAFSFPGLGPGRYEVQYQVDDEVIARSEQIILVAGGMVDILLRVAEKSPLNNAAVIGLGVGLGVGAVLLLALIGPTF